MAGLHDIAPIVSRRWVTKAVRAPIRAAAAAASHPACPPPTTMTSNSDFISRPDWALSFHRFRIQSNRNRNGVTEPVPNRSVSRETRLLTSLGVSRETSFTNAEVPENHVEDLFDVNPAGQAAECR